MSHNKKLKQNNDMKINHVNQTASLDNFPLEFIYKYAYQKKRAIHDKKNLKPIVFESGKLELRIFGDNSAFGDFMRPGEYSLDAQSIADLDEQSANALIQTHLYAFENETIRHILNLDDSPITDPESIQLYEHLPLWAGTIIADKEFLEFQELFECSGSYHNYVRFLDSLRLAEFYPHNEMCPIFSAFSQQIREIVGERYSEDAAINFLVSSLRNDSGPMFLFLSKLLKQYKDNPSLPFEFA